MINKTCIPVFYHIPKCGGTYILTKINAIIRAAIDNNQKESLKKLNTRIVNVRDNGSILARLFMSDVENYRAISDIGADLPYSISLDKIRDIRYDDIHSICIEPHGINANILSKIDGNFHQYTIVRHPVERIISLYNYLASEISLHEPTHFETPMTFIEFIKSPKFEPGWMLERFGNDNINTAIDRLKYITIYDIHNIEEAINYTIKRCFPKLNLDLEYDTSKINKNANTNQIVALGNIDDGTLKLLNTLMRKEILLYYIITTSLSYS